MSDVIGTPPCVHCGARPDFGETHDDGCPSERAPRRLAWRVETTVAVAWLWMAPSSGVSITVELESDGAPLPVQRLYVPYDASELVVAAQAAEYVIEHMPGARLVALHAPRGVQ